LATPVPAQGSQKPGVLPPRPLVLWALSLAGVAAAGCTFALAFASDHVAEPGLQATLFVWITLPYILGGVIARWRRPDNRFGPLMIVAGFVMFLSSLQWASPVLPYTIGLAFDIVPAAVFLHVFLAFPTGRLQTGLERIAVGAAYFAAVGFQLAKMMLGGVGPDNLLAIVAEPAAANTVQDVQLVALSALALAGIALLVARRRGAEPPLRRSVTLFVDSFALGLVMIAVLLTAGALELPAFETIRRITFGTIGIAPVAFLIGLVDVRLAREAVGQLLVDLRADPAPADLRDAFARALRDPSLTLAYWLPHFESWADLDGRSVELPGPGSGRTTTMIDRDGAHVAALVHRPLDDEPELLDAVSAAAEISLENGRLHAELRASLEELKGSRGRVIEAGQKERQRLERNLHDGAQQRLIALSLALRLLEERFAGDRESRSGLEQARSEIALSLDELREVARGIHPAVVSGHGLGVALESLAARGPVPVRLTVDLQARLQERLEVAAYYVVSESLANVGKHAHANSATVGVARTNGHLVVEVVDDGVGGADSERGTGLRGLADRVEALGGRLRVWTPHGGGTRVRAEIPCA
jgi:signal transduction histidine kinase